MKSFLISDKRDTLVGMRLAGIDGVLAITRDEVLDAIKTAIKNESIGILIMTENLVDLVSDEVLRLKLSTKRPLIVEIPGRHGTTRSADKIMNYIRDSVGIQI